MGEHESAEELRGKFIHEYVDDAIIEDYWSEMCGALDALLAATKREAMIEAKRENCPICGGNYWIDQGPQDPIRDNEDKEWFHVRDFGNGRRTGPFCSRVDTYLIEHLCASGRLHELIQKGGSVLGDSRGGSAHGDDLEGGGG